MREPAEDPYARVDYRRLIAWPERLRREAPFLLQTLSRGPQRSVIDLGCGTGEHSRFLASEGFRVVGLDSSESMIARAREPAPLEGLRFLQGDIREVDELLDQRFGVAICLGNTLVHFLERGELERAARAVSTVLLEDGLFILQILNYTRIFAENIRHLPLNFRAGTAEGEEVVFLRLMESLGGGRVRFCPATLRYRPGADPPLEVVSSRVVELRGWQRDELTAILDAAGLETIAVHGDMQRGDFDPKRSHDLVVVVRRGRSSVDRELSD